MNLTALSFNINDSDTKDFSYDKSYTLFDQSISCPASGAFPAFTGGFDVAVEAKADFEVAYGLAAVGSIIPPEINDFGVFVNVDATLNGILTVDANANVRRGLGYHDSQLTFDRLISVVTQFRSIRSVFLDSILLGEFLR